MSYLNNVQLWDKLSSRFIGINQIPGGLNYDLRKQSHFSMDVNIITQDDKQNWEGDGGYSNKQDFFYCVAFYLAAREVTDFTCYWLGNS